MNKLTLISAAAVAVLLTGSASLAQPQSAVRIGTVEHYSVQDGHNGVIQYRKANPDNIYAMDRRSVRTNVLSFPARTPSGKN